MLKQYEKKLAKWHMTFGFPKRIIKDSQSATAEMVGYTDPKTKTIHLARSLKKDRAMLISVMCHELSHALTTGSHGKRFYETLGRLHDAVLDVDVDDWIDQIKKW